VGELVVSGIPGVTLMKGYFKNERATARRWRTGGSTAAIRPAWTRTAAFFFVDRKKDMIKRAGENVSASEVEETLKQHPAVFDAAVVAIPDPIRDHAIKAYVILKEVPPPPRISSPPGAGSGSPLQGAGGRGISRRLPPDIRGQDPEASLLGKDNAWPPSFPFSTPM